MAATSPVENNKRQAIIDAATEAFLLHGYAGTSMDKVAAVAGAARRTVYNQFESKEALFEATVENLWQTLDVSLVTGAAAADLGAREGLLRLGMAVAEFWTPPVTVAFMRMVIAEGTRFPDLPKRFFLAGKTVTLRAVADFLKLLQGNGLIAIEDRALATRQFLGLIDEPLLWVRVVGINETYTPAQRRAIVETAVDMFLGFYRRPSLIATQ